MTESLSYDDVIREMMDNIRRHIEDHLMKGYPRPLMFRDGDLVEVSFGLDMTKKQLVYVSYSDFIQILDTIFSPDGVSSGLIRSQLKFILALFTSEVIDEQQYRTFYDKIISRALC